MCLDRNRGKISYNKSEGITPHFSPPYFESKTVQTLGTPVFLASSPLTLRLIFFEIISRLQASPKIFSHSHCQDLFSLIFDNL